MTDTQTDSAGWGFPGNSRKAHYFLSGDTRSLCSQWGFFRGPLTDDNHQSADNCAVCKRKRDALAQRRARA